MTKKFIFFLLLPCYAFALNIGIIGDEIGFENSHAPFDKTIVDIIEEVTPWTVHSISKSDCGTPDGPELLEKLLEKHPDLDAVVITLGFEDIWDKRDIGVTTANLKKMVRIAKINSVDILIGSIDFSEIVTERFIDNSIPSIAYSDYFEDELDAYAKNAVNIYPYLASKGADIFPFLTKEILETHTLAKMHTTEKENTEIVNRIIEIISEKFPNSSEK